MKQTFYGVGLADGVASPAEGEGKGLGIGVGDITGISVGTGVAGGVGELGYSYPVGTRCSVICRKVRGFSYISGCVNLKQNSLTVSSNFSGIT